MKAGEVIFQKLLDGKIQYVVPLYQRTYSWEEKHWEQLWDDLLEIYALPTPKNHFIGSVVTQQVDTAPEGASKYTLIDGQQRMTTLFILLSVVRQFAKSDTETWGNLAEEIQNTCLVNQYIEGDERIKLMPTQRDRSAFASVINGEIPPDSTLISQARSYFYKRLKQGDFDGNEINLRTLHSYIVNHLDMVSIRLDQDDSPNRIFESLNNTGMPLSVADLIRNYLFMNIPNLKDQEKAYNELWFPMEKLLTKRNSLDFSDFFWRYLMMDGSLPRWDDTYDALQEHLDPLTSEKVMDTLENFSKFSRYYAQIAGIHKLGLDDVILEQVKRLNIWRIDVAYPFLMRIFDSFYLKKISKEELVCVMQMIESFVIRRAVCGVPTNQLRKIFAQMSGQVDFSKFVESARSHLLNNRWPSNNEFHSAFVNFPLYTQRERARLILWTLENSLGHKETPALTSEITIEHIMPQTLSLEWENTLGENASEIHARWVDTIGNLTLSGYNYNLGQKPFAEKKIILANTNFALSGGLQKVDVWNATTIENRGNELAELASEIWKC
ncbi:MAG: DUF262 domain-containing protein [Candidatus Poribacteria bacterium]|nr:DUF262 domain-containing protein [Candidatus Poribacteria bacterium]